MGSAVPSGIDAVPVEVVLEFEVELQSRWKFVAELPVRRKLWMNFQPEILGLCHSPPRLKDQVRETKPKFLGKKIVRTLSA